MGRQEIFVAAEKTAHAAFGDAAPARTVRTDSRPILWRVPARAHSAGRPTERRYIEKATGKLQKVRLPAGRRSAGKRTFSFWNRCVARGFA
jgi:hypothetical protein